MMTRFSATIGVILLLIPLMGFVTAGPTHAIDTELADKCRQLMIRAYPHQSPGAKKGTAAAQRKYFQDCIKNNGIMPDINEPGPPTGTRR